MVPGLATVAIDIRQSKFLTNHSMPVKSKNKMHFKYIDSYRVGAGIHLPENMELMNMELNIHLPYLTIQVALNPRTIVSYCT